MDGNVGLCQNENIMISDIFNNISMFVYTRLPCHTTSSFSKLCCRIILVKFFVRDSFFCILLDHYLSSLSLSLSLHTHNWILWTHVLWSCEFNTLIKLNHSDNNRLSAIKNNGADINFNNNVIRFLFVLHT